jgi:hypothetical protein
MFMPHPHTPFGSRHSSVGSMDEEEERVEEEEEEEKTPFYVK